jgi:hypothetical protein
MRGLLANLFQKHTNEQLGEIFVKIATKALHQLRNALK